MNGVNMPSFVSLVKQMRTAQKAYFNEKDYFQKQRLLDESKRLEREVDKALKEWERRQNDKQAKLF